MRRAVRWLLVAAILAIISSVGASYFKRKDEIAKNEPAAPKPLESGIDGRFGDYKFVQNDGDKPKFSIRAKSGRQVREPSVFELEGLELEIFRDNAKVFDLVKSSRAEFDMSAKTLFSDGDVEITRGVPAEGQPPAGRLVKIHTSGVSYSSATGKATTDRPASFDFDRGGGSSRGVEYDPATGELFLKEKVVLDWKSRNPEAPPMHIEAGEAVYLERESKVALRKWSKLDRGPLHMDGGMSLVTLDKGVIRTVGTQNAKGVRNDSGRSLEFAADELNLNFNEAMAVETIQGRNHARLVSGAPNARTTVTGNRLDLVFTPMGHDSLLTTAVSTGGSVADSVPINDTADARTLKSEVIRLFMRAGGREIERVETDGPGTLDLVPTRPGQPKRNLKGDRFLIAYGADNRIQSFKTSNASTRTERPNRPVMTTSSKDFEATFDPKTNQLSQIEQKANFEYREGDRQAKGDRAVMDQAKSVMTLDGSARVWDPTGTATADHIELDQNTGNYLAEGKVASTRQPGPKGSTSPLLSNQEVMQARSQKLTVTDRGQKLHYEGNAVAWQGANHVEGNKIDIDQDRRVIEAHGDVNSQFADKTPQDAKSKPKSAAAVFTIVKAQDLVYTEATKLAHYQGGITLTRPGLTVTGRELHAYLNDSNEENSLDKAIVDGSSKIVSVTTDAKQRRIRTGTSEHSEYYTAEQKLIMEGGQPELVDSAKGKTTGRQLTWWANSDRLLVDGEESKPALSTIRKSTPAKK
jgi:lipopolysaccharide export system protein LptA